MNVNVVLFGEGGVGKTSITKLVAGEAVSEPSPVAWGSTSNSQQYTFEVNGKGYAIWDTIGLGESIPGASNHLDAIKKMYALIQQIQAQGGLDLLLYCIPGAGSRITETTLSNYRLFFEVLCEKQVPIAVVVTRLEEEVEMDEWWDRNEKYLDQCGLKFSGHACVTGLSSHPKAGGGRAALESLLLRFDHTERPTERPTMPPTSGHSSGFFGRRSRTDKDESKQLERQLRDRLLRANVNHMMLEPPPPRNRFIRSGSRLKTLPGSAFRLYDDDIVVFLVGPSDEKSAFLRMAIQDLRRANVRSSRQPSMRKVQAIRCKIPQDAKTTLRAEERRNIVFVAMPSFHVDPKADAKAVKKISAWLKKSKSKSTLVGTIYMHSIEKDPTQDPIQRHLDSFAGTFPENLITQAFPMRLHCVFSHRDESTEISITDHKEKFQEQVNALRPRIVNGWKPRWKASIHDDIFVGDGRGGAWKVVEALFSTPGRW